MSALPQNFGRRIRQTRFNPLRSLTPQSLARALDQFDAGYLRDFALLCEQIIDRDDVLSGAVAKRSKAVSRRPWEIVPADADDAAAKAHAAALTEFWRSIRVVNAADENQRGGVRLLVRQLMSAPFYGYAAHEVVWATLGAGGRMGGGITAEFRFVPLYFFENLTGRLRFIGPDGAALEGAELPEDAWLVTASDQALMKAASICYLFKRLSLQDWLNFSERFGIPGIHGEIGAAKDSDEWTAFVEALDAFANDWVTATNAGAKINLIESSKTGDQPFAPMVERMDRRLASLCRGADLSTISGDNRESGASLQGEEADLLVEDDCEFVTEALEPISRRVIAWQFGEGVEPLARFVITPPKPSDTRLDIEVDAFLRDSGAPLGIADTLERYGRSLPKQGDELLSGSVAPAETGGTPGKPSTENDVAVGEDSSLLRTALARALGVVPQWLAPIEAELRALEAKAADGISDEELLDFTEAAARRLPELFAELNIAALADELEAATGTAVINGVTAAFRKHRRELKPE